MFFSVIHEIGHIVTGLVFRMKPEKLEVMPFGLAISFYFNENKIKELFVTLAGPITSLVVAILCTNQEMAYSNILILLFNLLPLYPLDGGRIIKTLLDMKLEVTHSEKLIDKISKITLIILTIISSIAVYYYKNIAIFLVCIFLWFLVIQEKNGKTIDILAGK